MELSTYVDKLTENKLLNSLYNFIKKFTSSKSYWSVSYLILLFTIREAIAWKFGNAIETFFQNQAEASEYPFVWETFGFFLSAGGSIELVILGVFLFMILSLVKIFGSKDDIDTKEIVATKSDEIQTKQDKHSQQLQKIENLIKLQGGDETAFLEKYFGDDYKEVLENPQTYDNLKVKLQENRGSIELLIEEKEELQKKIESRRLHSNDVQKMIDKAFKELRFDDVLDLLDNFIENNKELEKDLINAHYQKALAYMEKIEYHKAKEEFEQIGSGIKDTDILNDYGIMYHKIAEYDKAIETYDKVLSIKQTTIREIHPSTAKTYMHLGLSWNRKGKHDKAIELYNKALVILHNHHRENNHFISHIYIII